MFSRTERLFGADALRKLKNSKVIVFGLGGVGGAAFESLVRGGVGCVDVVDKDKVDITNLNRQILATEKTVGMLKTDAAFLRAKDISPETEVNRFPVFYLPENADSIDLSKYDYIVDAIDNVSAKVEIAVRGANAGVPVVSCMGTGNKVHPEMLTVSDIEKTSVCPLARAVRHALKKRGINHLTVVYSKEEPFAALPERTPASNSFVPPAAGYMAASVVIRNLTDIKR